MYKFESSEKNYEYDWIKMCFDNAGHIEVHHEVDASHAYEFDMWALVKYERKWYIVGTHGCSCPSPDERAEIELGPLTKKEMIKQIKAGNYSSYTMPKEDEAALIKYLDEV